MNPRPFRIALSRTYGNEKNYGQIENVTCEIKEWNDEVIYSYKISKGISKRIVRN